MINIMKGKDILWQGMLGMVLFFVLVLTGMLGMNERKVWADTVYSGDYSETVHWRLDSEGVLRISGSGEWEAQDIGYYENVKKVVIASDVTMIPDYFLYLNTCTIQGVTFEDRTSEITLGKYSLWDVTGEVSFGAGTYNLGEHLIKSTGRIYLYFNDGTYNIGENALTYSYLKEWQARNCKIHIETYGMAWNRIEKMEMDSVELVAEERAFYDKVIDFMYLGKGTYELGEECFSCSGSSNGTRKVELGKGFYDIGSKAFYHNEKLDTFIIEDSNYIKNLGVDAFLESSLQCVYSRVSNPMVEKVISITDKISRIEPAYQGDGIVEGEAIIPGLVCITCVSELFGTYTIYGDEKGVKLKQNDEQNTSSGYYCIEVSYCGNQEDLYVKKKIKEVTSLCASYEGSVLEGTDIDPKKVTLVVNYNNGTRETYTGEHSGIIFSTTKALGSGEGVSGILLTYKNCSCILSVMREKKSLSFIEAYYDGEVLEETKIDKGKIRLILHYDNDTTEQMIPSEQEVFLSQEMITGKGTGENQIIVTYQEKSASMNVRRKEKTMNQLTVWYDGEVLEGKELQRDKLCVIAYYDNETQEEVEEYNLLEYEIVPGINYISVEFGGYKDSCPVYGVRKKISAVTGTYTEVALEGTKLDKDKLQVIIWYDNDTSDKCENYILEDYNIQAGENSIQISYENVSGTVKVTGIEKSLVSITAVYSGEKITKGMPLDREKLIVMAYYDNGSSRRVEDYQLEGKEIELGNNILQVQYQGMCTHVEVEGKEATLLEISAAYDGKILQGMSVDKEKLVVMAYYDNGVKEVIEDYELGNYEIKPGMNSIRIIAKDKVCYLSVEGKAKSLENIAAVYLGEAWEGNVLNQNDIKVTKLYDNHTMEEVSDFHFVQTVLVKGNNPIEITCDGMKTTLCVVGKEKVNSSAIKENVQKTSLSQQEEEKKSENTIVKTTLATIESDIPLKIKEKTNKEKSVIYTSKTVTFSYKKLLSQKNKVYYKVVKLGKKNDMSAYKQGKNGILKVKAGEKIVVYFKIITPWNETKYLQTQPFTIDKDAPVLKGIKNGRKYKKKAVLTFIDKESGISYVKVNGKKINKKLLSKGSIVFEKKGKYVVQVKNNAGLIKKLLFFIK